jgi:hypothetical protein
VLDRVDLDEHTVNCQLPSESAREVLIDLDEHTVNCLRLILSTACRVTSKETCYEGERESWSKERPLTGHCGVLAYIVNVVLGGEILSGRDSDNVRWLWNRLPNGTQVALTSSDPFNITFTNARVLRKRKTVNDRYFQFLIKMEQELANA